MLHRPAVVLRALSKGANKFGTAVWRRPSSALPVRAHWVMSNLAQQAHCSSRSSWQQRGRNDLRDKISAFNQACSFSSVAPETVIVCDTPEEYDAAVATAADQQKLVVSYFTASWCGPCKMIAPTFSQLSAKYAERAVFLKIDVDDNDQVAMDNNISMMPTFLFQRDGEQLAEMAGADKNQLISLVESLTA